VESKLQDLFDAALDTAVPELVKAFIAAHAINPRLHQVLNEEIPMSERSPSMQKADERITELLRAYLRQRVYPQNIEMTVFILSRTVETLCHSAVIEYPSFISNSQFEQEVSSLLLLYLKSVQ
jgi:hypothetical protein